MAPILVKRGLSLTQASGYGSVFALAIGVSGLVTGTLFDRAPAGIVVAVTQALSAIGNVLLVVTTPLGSGSYAIMLAVALAGLATGTEGNHINYFSARLFGLRNFARAASMMALTISIGMAIGGLCYSVAFDRSGGYATALAAGAALYVLAAILFIGLRMQRS